MSTIKGGYLLTVAAGVAVFALSGCTTKNYVKKQTAPLMNHVNDLDALTAKNTNSIKDLESSTKKGIAGVNDASQQAQQKAQAASSDANRVSGQLGQTSQQIQALDQTVANLDNYHLAYQDAVHFAFDKWALTPAGKAILDGVIARLQDPHTILEVQGYTDSTGPADYNYKLSEWRADSVVRYLESKGMAPHRIFLIGLGKNQFVAPNSTPAGRSQNRRVELKVMANALSKAPEAAQPSGAVQK